MNEKSGENRPVIRYSEAFKMEIVRELEDSGANFEQIRRTKGTQRGHKGVRDV